MMAVTITKAGKLPSEKLVAGTCLSCGTQFTFTAGHASLVNDRDGNFYSLQCPLSGCGKTVNVGIRRSTGFR